MKIKKVNNIKTMTIMKKITFILSVLFMAGLAAHAQTDACESGFCPETITAHHHKGVDGMSVAPVDATITYKVVQTNITGTDACWITQNLGASQQATSSTDGSLASRGWFWQFNRKQGYYYDGSRIPNTTWVTSIDETTANVSLNPSRAWQPENDPCTILLGEHWRIPTVNEWNTADSWGTPSEVYGSVFKIHLAGVLNIGAGVLGSNGTLGTVWSSNEVSATNASALSVDGAGTTSLNKTLGANVRCIRDFSW